MVTVLFTDLVASTDALSRLGADQNEAVRREYFALVREVLAKHAGREVKNPRRRVHGGVRDAERGPRRGSRDAAAPRRAEPARRRTAPHARRDLARGGRGRRRRLLRTARGRSGATVPDRRRRDDRHQRRRAGSRGASAAGTCSRPWVRSTSRVSTCPWRRTRSRGRRSPARRSLAFRSRPASRLPRYDVRRPRERVRALARRTRARRADGAAAHRPRWRGTRESARRRSSPRPRGSAHDEGALVLYGRCDEELSIPYQPWREAVAFLAQHQLIDDADRGALALLLPDGSAPVVPGGPGADAERYALFGAVIEVLRARFGDRANRARARRPALGRRADRVAPAAPRDGIRAAPRPGRGHVPRCRSRWGRRPRGCAGRAAPGRRRRPRPSHRAGRQ